MALGGCSGDLVAAFQASGPEVGSKVEPAMATALGTAPDETTTNYKTREGPEVLVSLGPAYMSARGQTCRMARARARHLAYGFCRKGADWYAIPPVAIADE